MSEKDEPGSEDAGELNEEKTLAKERWRELLDVFDMTQERFAEASGGKMTRVQVNQAATGRNLYKTQPWLEGIRSVTGASLEDVTRWRSGQISTHELRERATEVDPAIIAAAQHRWDPSTTEAMRAAVARQVGIERRKSSERATVGELLARFAAVERDLFGSQKVTATVVDGEPTKKRGR